MIKIKHGLYLSFMASFFLFFMVSCKKEYVKTSYTNIEEFSITDSAGNKLKASISGDSIRVYWPPFQTVPATVMPNITVSVGASISPTSGSSISFKNGTSYTVTAQNGDKKKYILVPMINQPQPVFEINANSINLGGTLTLNGQYFVADSFQTKLFLISSSNKEIPLSLKDPLSFNSLSISIQLPNDLSIDTGNYKLKLISGANTIIKGPFHIGKPDVYNFLINSSFNEAGKILKAGDEISISHTVSELRRKYYPGKFDNLQLTVRPSGGSEDGYDDIYYDIVMSSQDNENLSRYKLPSDVAQGTIYSIMLSYEFNSNGDIIYPFYWDGTTEPTTTISK
jgi:hypothetical protein